MTIESVGYRGSVWDSQWAQWAPHLGVRHWVEAPGDLTPTVASASARQVQVAAGTAGGSGIMDTLDEPESVTLAPLASGSRVDVVVLRRSWTPTQTPTGTTSVAVVSGPTLTAALAALRRTPGTAEGADQPVGAFQVATSGGTTSVVLLADLRVWGANGGLVAATADTLPTIDDPGTVVQVGADTWTRTVRKGSAEWLQASSLRSFAGSGLSGMMPADAQLILQAGSVVNTSDQSGYSRITWPRQFPGGLLAVLLANGDDYTTPGLILAQAGQFSPWGAEGMGTVKSVVYMARSANGTVARGLQHRTNFLAVGW